MANIHTVSVDFLHILETMGVEARIYQLTDCSHFLNDNMDKNFSRGFWRRAGQNTADRLSNAVFGENWARPIKHIRAETASRRQSLAEDAQLNSVHSAILENADSVRGIEFDEDSNEMVEQLHDLSIQLKAERWRCIIGVNSDKENQGEENRMRNQFTDTLFAKYKRGLTLLERRDPFNRDIWYFKWVRYIAGWRKFFGKSGFLLLFILPIGIGLIYSGIQYVFEWYQNLIREDNYLYICLFWLGIICAIALRTYIAFFYQVNALISNVHRKRQEKKQQMEQKSEEIAPATDIEAQVTEEEPPIDPNEIMQTEHDYLWDKYGNSNEIMQRGYHIYHNSTQKDILLVGYNPSFDKGEKVGNQQVYQLPDRELVKRMLVSCQTDLRDRTAYIDLFSFRESNHQVANQQIVLNPQMFNYVIEQVCLSQNMIEEVIRPKVIIILYKDTWAYFGKLPEYTWMGYRYLTCSAIIHHEFSRIVDYSNKTDRINIEREHTNLKNTKVLFLDENDLQSFPTPEEIEKILR